MAETTLVERLGGSLRPVPAQSRSGLPTGVGAPSYCRGMGKATSAETNLVWHRPDQADNMHNAGAGWYYDPDDQAVYRYWDGRRWTEHCSYTFLSTVPS